MKSIAIDDEPKALNVIRHFAAKVPSLQLVKEFRSSLDALDFLSQEKVDLVFLDINMPDLTGLEFLQALPQPPMIIFITAYAEYAVQSYDWNTVGYLLKPIEFPKFLRAVNKAASQMNSRSRDTQPESSVNKNDDFLLIKSGPQTYQLKVNDILYVEASGNHVVLVTKERKVTTLNSLQEVAKLLPPHLFYQVHKSFIVSLPHIEIIESFQVKINGIEIPLGKAFRGIFLEQFKK